MAEGGGLLNRCTGSTRTVSSNLIPSARPPTRMARRGPRFQRSPWLRQRRFRRRPSLMATHRVLGRDSRTSHLPTPLDRLRPEVGGIGGQERFEIVSPAMARPGGQASRAPPNRVT